MNPAKNPTRATACVALAVAAVCPMPAHASATAVVRQNTFAGVPVAAGGALGSALDQALARDLGFAWPLAWLEQKVVLADGQADDLFGFRVLVSGDQAFISAPAPIYRPGAVYVFARSNGVWNQTQTLTPTPDSPPPPGWSDFFGWSLSLSGNTLLVGSPFTLDQMLGPIGSAYVFTLSGGVWSQTQELTASDAFATDWFGVAVALAGDTAIIGANAHNRGANGTEGAAYVFTNTGGVWSQTQEIEPSDGVPGDGHGFGGSVVMDGTVALVGAPGPDYSSDGTYPQGAAYVLANSAGTWSEIQKLTASDGADGDQFGFSLALSGTTALIGASAADIGGQVHQGAAYAFDGSGASWTDVQKLTAGDGVAYAQFGQSIAMNGARALVGEWNFDDDPTGPPAAQTPGSVYLFERSNGSWSQSQELVPGDGAAGDSFGWDVALDASTLLVGAQGNVGGNAFQGAAYFYSEDTIFGDGFDGVP